MSEAGAVPSASDPRRGPGSVVVTAAAAVSPFGRGLDPLLAGVLGGQSAFRPVTRFEVAGRRVKVAATLPGEPVLRDELVGVIGEACDTAGLSAAQRAGTPLFLALHSDPAGPRSAEADRPQHGADSFAASVALHSGLSDVVRAYTSA